MNIMIIIYLVLIVACMWVPGVLLAKNMVKAVRGDSLNAKEWVLAVIPGYNLIVSREAIYGSARYLWIANVIVTVALIQRYVLYMFFDTALVASLVSLILLWVVMVAYYAIQVYTLWDMSNCAHMGLIVKVCSVVIPPLAYYMIAVSGTANIRSQLEESDEFSQQG